jgi:hypothetical protein
MSCARKSWRRPRGPAGTVFDKPHFRLTLSFLVIAGLTPAIPADAQPVTGTSSGGGVPGGGVPTGAGPNILPPVPSGPFGLPNPLAPPNALPNGVTPAAPAAPSSALALPQPGAGITTLQLYDPNAPAVLIQSYASVGETLYDNVNYTATNHVAAAETTLSPGVSISADTARFQGVLSGGATGSLYTPTSNLDQITGNLFGQGTGTIVPDRLYVDLSSYITQASTLPGLGFITPSLLPRTQQTQTFGNLVSPYLVGSFGRLVDTELRYRFGATNFGGTTGITSTTVPVSTTVANGILNEGTFTATTGQDFTRTVSRLTIDASGFNSNSTSQNTQFNAFDDIQYFFKPNISALVRAGYQKLQYPFSPTADFAGPTWLAGGRLGSAADYGYATLQYGRVQGVYGFNGSANYQLTPTITVQAYLTQGISSPAQSFQSSLASSSLSPTGAIVNPSTGLPTAFFNPGLGLTNNVYRYHQYNAGVNDQIGRNSYSIYAYYYNSQTLTQPITPPTNSMGTYFSWGRDIRPDLNGNASVGYSRTTNVVTINTPTPVSNTSTVTANIGINYTFARALSGSVVYTFSYQPNGGTIVNGRPGDIVANTLQLFLTKTF